MARPALDRNTTLTTETIMGHQVNFYLDSLDSMALEQALRDLGPLLVLHSLSPGSEPRILESANFQEGARPWLFVLLVRPEDLHAVVTRYVSAQGHWTVDVVKSPVIEFDRCFFDGTILRRGRLYYVDGYYDGEAWKEKADAFQQWAKAVLAKAKRVLKKHGSDYIGTGAAGWASLSGGKLIP